MAKGPAVVFIARHGARLDAADKSWHLTSPTPYDPPLTYGGWSQGKALGLRIAALLHQRDTELVETSKHGADDLAHLEFSKLDSPKTQPADGSQPKKKRKIIIHSSPYLRCVQTSTAVAAGISLYHPPGTPHLKVPEPSKERHGALGTSPVAKSPRSRSPLRLPMNFQPLADPSLEVFSRLSKGPEKILLRIDAFLGEWLSPDYFEDITPPPNSTMMVASAKSDLLRRGDYIQQMSNAQNSKGHFPGGWMGKGATPASTPSPPVGTSPSPSSLASAAAFRDRASSQGSKPLIKSKSRENIGSLALGPAKSLSAHQRPHKKYEAPTPTYSIASTDPIPRGYTAHAREACILMDFQWDSMRPPQEWGDGGEYGDEWSTMHKRFRRGLAGMMDWYREHGAAPPKEQIRGFMDKQPLRLTPTPAASSTAKSDGDAEDDEELVLILITHGAGCNALLGAITNQPVLIDVGLASLSMAVRRPSPRKVSVPTVVERRSSVVDPGMTETYEMKLLASVDHLKPGVDPSKPQTPSQTRSPALFSSPSVDSRRRFTGSSGAISPLDSPLSIGEPLRSWNSSLGSMRRTMSSGSGKGYMSSNLNPSGTASPSSSGLWSSPKILPDGGSFSSEGKAEPGADMMLNFANQPPHPKPASTTTVRPSPDLPSMDGVADLVNDLKRLNTNEQKEVSDSIGPLRTGTSTSIGANGGGHNRGGSSNSPNLWAKPQPKSGHGLWGPPRLDDVYEHGRGPKRRWTVTERKESV